MLKKLKKKFHDFYFGVKPEDIEIGSTWERTFASEEDPFKRELEGWQVKVLDVKEGYIKYKFMPASKYGTRPESCSEDSFRYIYIKVKENQFL